MHRIGVIRGFLAALPVWLAAPPALADHSLFVIHAPPAMHRAGFYWGGHVGLQWVEIAGQSLADPARTAKFEERSWSAGLGVGYDHEISTVIFGWVADIDLTRAEIESRVRNVPIPDAGLTVEQAVLATELKWLTTLRGRIGLRIDRFVPFATAGLAVANAESRSTAELRSHADPTVTTVVSASGSEWVAGLAAGAGVEYRLTARDTIGIEYLYVDLPIGNEGARLLGRTTANDFTSHIVRLLFRYRF